MEKWEAVLKLVNLNMIDFKYQCTVCRKKYKLERRAWNHIEKKHEKNILEIKNQSIREEI